MFTIVVLEKVRAAYVLRGDQAIDYSAAHDADRVGSGDMALTTGKTYHVEMFRDGKDTITMFWFPTDISDEFAIAAAYKAREGLRMKERHAKG